MSAPETRDKPIAEKWGIKRLINLDFQNIREKYQLLDDGYFAATTKENFCCSHMDYHGRCLRTKKSGCDELILKGSSYQYVLLCCDWKYKLDRATKWAQTVAFFREKGVYFDKACNTRFFVKNVGATRAEISPVEYFCTNFQQVFVSWKAKSNWKAVLAAESCIRTFYQTIGVQMLELITLPKDTSKPDADDGIEIKFVPGSLVSKKPEQSPISGTDDSDDDVIIVGVSYDKNKVKATVPRVKEEPTESANESAAWTRSFKQVVPPAIGARMAEEREPEAEQEPVGFSPQRPVNRTRFSSSSTHESNNSRSEDDFPLGLLTHEQYFKYYLINKFKRDFPNSDIKLADVDIEQMWKIDSKDPDRKAKIIADCWKHNLQFQKNY